MEYLDIVNQKDEVIGKEERNKSHENHLLHRSVIVLLVNDKDEILLQLRKANKKQYPLFWAGSVNGHVSSGETPMEAARKEMKEEVGLVEEIEFVDKFMIDDEVEHEMVNVFFGRSNGPFDVDKYEVEKIDLVSVEELKKNFQEMKMTPHCKRALELVFEKYF